MKYVIMVLGLCFKLSIIQAQLQPNVATYAPINGLEMYYEIYGEGEPLILVHGSFMTIATTYGQFIPELAKSNKVIAMELQGHGHTKNIERPFSYENFADDIIGLMDHLNIDRAHLIGYSLGATIALKTALRYPDRTNKIVFISSVYSMDGWLPEIQQTFANMKPEYLTNTPLKSAYDEVAPDPSQWISFVEGMIAFENRPFDLNIDEIKKRNLELLIINGDYDGVDLNHSQELFRAVGGGGFGIMEPLSNSRLAVIPGTTHITLMQKTGVLLNYIAPFLRNISKE